MLSSVADRVVKSLRVRSNRALRGALHVGHWGAPESLTPAASLRYRERMQRLFPDAYERYRELGQSVPGDGAFTVPEESAFGLLDASGVDAVRDAVTRSRELLERARQGGDPRRLSVGKEYLVRLPLDRADLALDSPLVRVALHPKLLAPAARYLGVLPILREVVLLYSPNDVPLGPRGPVHGEYNSQYAHLDEPADRHMRVLLHASDVTESAGPFHAVPGSDSDAITSLLGRSNYLNRLSDEDLFRHGRRALGRDPEIRKAVGPAGTVAFADSCRLWHYGSREGTEPRLLLSIWYCHPYSANFLPPPIQRLNNAVLGFPRLRRLATETLDPVERAVLGAAP